jgi:hypothetical protein
MSTILKVNEKNCYPSKHGCQHSVQILNLASVAKGCPESVQTVLMNSEDIFNNLNRSGDCPLHIVQQHEIHMRSKIIQ